MIVITFRKHKEEGERQKSPIITKKEQYHGKDFTPIQRRRCFDHRIITYGLELSRTASTVTGTLIGTHHSKNIHGHTRISPYIPVYERTFVLFAIKSLQKSKRCIKRGCSFLKSTPLTSPQEQLQQWPTQHWKGSIIQYN